MTIISLLVQKNILKICRDAKWKSKYQNKKYRKYSEEYFEKSGYNSSQLGQKNILKIGPHAIQNEKVTINTKNIEKIKNGI